MVSGKHNDSRLARLNGSRLYGSLLRCGVEVYEYNHTMLHHKIMIVDGVWATVGTTNFDNRSFAHNAENNICFAATGCVASCASRSSRPGDVRPDHVRGLAAAPGMGQGGGGGGVVAPGPGVRACFKRNSALLSVGSFPYRQMVCSVNLATRSEISVNMDEMLTRGKRRKHHVHAVTSSGSVGPGWGAKNIVLS